MTNSDQDRPGSGSGNGGTNGNGNADFQRAVERLEQAVHELVNAKKDEFSGRATAFIDETTDRLQREFRSGGNGRSRDRHRHHRRRYHSHSRDRYRSSGDPSKAKIAGVCANIASYYGMEPWVVRCIAVTGLLFLPSIVFPAYWIAFFVMKKSRYGGRSAAEKPVAAQDHSSPAPELGPSVSPRYSLRSVQDNLARAELKLRRMESHVTSGQFELQRELNKIDG